MLDALRQHGALFQSELGTATGRLPVEVEEGLWDRVARGLVTADGFQAVRSLLRRGGRAPPRRRRGLRRGIGAAGGRARRAVVRCCPRRTSAPDRDELAEDVAEQLAARWGVVFRDLARRENLAVPWREVLWALRRLEARGIIRGGRFVTGFSGEQYAHPEAVDVCARSASSSTAGEPVRLSAADPLNLTGIVLPGPRDPGDPHQLGHLHRRRGRHPGRHGRSLSARGRRPPALTPPDQPA